MRASPTSSSRRPRRARPRLFRDDGRGLGRAHPTSPIRRRRGTRAVLSGGRHRRRRRNEGRRDRGRDRARIEPGKTGCGSTNSSEGRRRSALETTPMAAMTSSESRRADARDGVEARRTARANGIKKSASEDLFDILIGVSDAVTGIDRSNPNGESTRSRTRLLAAFLVGQRLSLAVVARRAGPPTGTAKRDPTRFSSTVTTTMSSHVGPGSERRSLRRRERRLATLETRRRNSRKVPQTARDRAGSKLRALLVDQASRRRRTTSTVDGTHERRSCDRVVRYRAERGQAVAVRWHDMWLGRVRDDAGAGRWRDRDSDEAYVGASPSKLEGPDAFSRVEAPRAPRLCTPRSGRTRAELERRSRRPASRRARRRRRNAAARMIIASTSRPRRTPALAVLGAKPWPAARPGTRSRRRRGRARPAEASTLIRLARRRGRTQTKKTRRPAGRASEQAGTTRARVRHAPPPPSRSRLPPCTARPRRRRESRAGTARTRGGLAERARRRRRGGARRGGAARRLRAGYVQSVARRRRRRRRRADESREKALEKRCAAQDAELCFGGSRPASATRRAGDAMRWSGKVFVAVKPSSDMDVGVYPVRVHDSFGSVNAYVAARPHAPTPYRSASGGFKTPRRAWPGTAGSTRSSRWRGARVVLAEGVVDAPALEPPRLRDRLPGSEPARAGHTTPRDAFLFGGSSGRPARRLEAKVPLLFCGARARALTAQLSRRALRDSPSTAARPTRPTRPTTLRTRPWRRCSVSSPTSPTQSEDVLVSTRSTRAREDPRGRAVRGGTGTTCGRGPTAAPACERRAGVGDKLAQPSRSPRTRRRRRSPHTDAAKRIVGFPPPRRGADRHRLWPPLPPARLPARRGRGSAAWGWRPVFEVGRATSGDVDVRRPPRPRPEFDRLPDHRRFPRRPPRRPDRGGRDPTTGGRRPGERPGAAATLSTFGDRGGALTGRLVAARRRTRRSPRVSARPPGRRRLVREHLQRKVTAPRAAPGHRARAATLLASLPCWRLKTGKRRTKLQFGHRCDARGRCRRRRRRRVVEQVLVPAGGVEVSDVARRLRRRVSDVVRALGSASMRSRISPAADGAAEPGPARPRRGLRGDDRGGGHAVEPSFR